VAVFQLKVTGALYNIEHNDEAFVWRAPDEPFQFSPNSFHVMHVIGQALTLSFTLHALRQHAAANVLSPARRSKSARALSSGEPLGLDGSQTARSRIGTLARAKTQRSLHGVSRGATQRNLLAASSTNGGGKDSSSPPQPKSGTDVRLLVDTNAPPAAGGSGSGASAVALATATASSTRGAGSRSVSQRYLLSGSASPKSGGDAGTAGGSGSGGASSRPTARDRDSDRSSHAGSRPGSVALPSRSVRIAVSHPSGAAAADVPGALAFARTASAAQLSAAFATAGDGPSSAAAAVPLPGAVLVPSSSSAVGGSVPAADG
jgi:hypothetical protein